MATDVKYLLVAIAVGVALSVRCPVLAGLIIACAPLVWIGKRMWR